MKKKLLMTASTFPRWKGDTEPRFVLDLAKALLKYFDVTVLAPAAVGAKDKEILEGVKVIRYHYLPFHNLETLCYPGAIVPRIKERKIRALQIPFLFFALWWNLFKLRNKFDFIHAHWLIPQGIVQPFANTNYLVTGHGADVTSLNKSVVKILKGLCLRKAKYITVVSEKLKQDIIDVYGISEKKIAIIPMGCDTTNFSPKYRNENYYKKNGKKNIVFVGRLAEKKGVKYLIDAMKYLDANLYIIGKGPLEEELKQQALEYGDKIVFLGAKTHQELPEAYASADIFVAPSVTAKDGDQEGFGLVIIEAMASGVPVVASKSGGIVDIVRDGKNGFLVEEKNSMELAKKIDYLLNDPLLYDKFRNNGFITANKYDYKQISEKYKKIIERM